MIAELEEQKKLLNGLTTQLPFSTNSLNVLAKRYLQKDENNEKVIETPEQMFNRVATALAEVENNYGKTSQQIEQIRKQFYDVLSNFEFTPAGRTLTNAGSMTRLIANCIVLHINDSMEEIFQTLKEASLLQQAGSGLGFPLHLMRPAGSPTKTSQGVASGPVSFLNVYNRSFGVIKQQNRHGANMAVMCVDHPDILEFIHSKDKEGNLKNFNVSVGLTNEFMEKVRSNDPSLWMCTWKDKKIKPRKIARDENFIVKKVEEVNMTAKEIFQEIIQCAWNTGEPGCVFLDKVNETNPIPGLGRIEACNPCGEQFLHDGDVCNLGSINLEKFATPEGGVDFERLRQVTKISTRMLDNVIDLSDFPVEKVNQVFRNNRRIGLGIMGFADLLYQIKVPYNSEEGREIAEQVMKCIQESSHEMSQQLAEEKGVFPNWNISIYAQKGIKMRNAALTNIAPTGTISMMFDVSGGVEPYFALAYHYKDILGGDVSLSYLNKHLETALKEANAYSDEVMETVIKEGTLKTARVPESIKKVFVTSMDISPEDHTRMQAAFQKYCDNAISKTINFPNSATKEDVLQGYILAWELGCKGCTVYRDGSRQLQVLNLNKDKEKEILVKSERSSHNEKADYFKVETGYGPLQMHINYDDIGPTRVFVNLSPIGTEISGLASAIGILLSKYFKLGGNPVKILKHLNSIKGDKPHGFGPNRVDSIPNGISKALRNHLIKTGKIPDVSGQVTLNKMTKELKKVYEEKAATAPIGVYCPKCHSNNVRIEGNCPGPTCFDCGYSECN
ncbi:MAG: adenosylcobalamin-dependent ribonucleoside-diphosphate reductase [Candidatus Woesearchaeota archaeon]|nr:MAG: adenosylcobalamin-dependent ribonucleoside-diphosphate reductase [Candidatus Woesearchaeota archaeon]